MLMKGMPLIRCSAVIDSTRISAWKSPTSTWGEATGKVSGVGQVASFEVDGVSASLLGRLPIDGGLSVIGRIGAIKWDSEAKLLNDKEKDNGTDPIFGGGLEYSNQSLFARAEYTRYMLDVDSGSSDEDVDIDLWSLSAGMYF